MDDQPTVHKTFLYSQFAKAVSRFSGRPAVFGVAVIVILAWALTGPVFDYSNTWQLIINTGTTIVTFLMVFVIQNTQMRDTEAMQVKLDELIRAVEGARNDFVELDRKESDEIEAAREQMREET